MRAILRYRVDGNRKQETMDLDVIPTRGRRVPIHGRTRQVRNVDWNISETVLDEGEEPHVVINLHD